MKKRELTGEEITILLKYKEIGAKTMLLTGDRNLLEFYSSPNSVDHRAAFYLQIGRQPGRPFGDIQKFREYNIADLIREGRIEKWMNQEAKNVSN